MPVVKILLAIIIIILEIEAAIFGFLWTDPWTFGIGIGLLMFFALLWHEAKHPRPKVYVSQAEKDEIVKAASKHAILMGLMGMMGQDFDDREW